MAKSSYLYGGAARGAMRKLPRVVGSNFENIFGVGAGAKPVAPTSAGMSGGLMSKVPSSIFEDKFGTNPVTSLPTDVPVHTLPLPINGAEIPSPSGPAIGAKPVAIDHPMPMQTLPGGMYSPGPSAQLNMSSAPMGSAPRPMGGAPRPMGAAPRPMGAPQGNMRLGQIAQILGIGGSGAGSWKPVTSGPSMSMPKFAK